jgi:hypothetical protein
MPLGEVIKFDFAEGSVDPETRIANGEIERDKVNELIARLLSREFIVKTDEHALPCMCMDCRPKADGEPVEDVKAAGGTTTLVVSDALTTDRFRKPGEKAAEHKRRVVKEIKSHGYRVGGHNALGVSVPGYAGCGAEDKLDAHEPGQPSILEFLVRNHELVFNALRSLGYQVDDELERNIISKAESLRSEGYATTGAELSQAGVEAAGEESRVTLAGPQNAVAVAIMTQPGERLDQRKILGQYGTDYEVFEIEAWSIKNAADVIADDPEEARQKEIAGVAYNLAAGGVIAGPGMPVVIL